MEIQQINDLIAWAQPFRGQPLVATQVDGQNRVTSTYTFTGITNTIGFGSPMSYQIFAILTSITGKVGTASLKSVVEYFEALKPDDAGAEAA
jgi:hypothetical protein